MLTNKNSPTFIKPGLPQRIVFTVELMTCGMLLRGWIEWGVDIKIPAYGIKQGFVKSNLYASIEHNGSSFSCQRVWLHSKL